ncbi:polysaccharide deacetylase family protein [Streptomyces rubiginosohelvolus]|uniref:polysaccharide deacetylase family protein n=1 Tax=Streptomyces TaxID=1883 RepID=UPI000BF0FBB3|nr:MULTISPECIES: polysaccharide deacetylase family protein [unclassified Streptomyces]MBK3532196.1 polysaccharide deacetylase family protein [Streptomyces sp. MBT72]MBK3540689.1 polysaccharide deacetylase family protein [Streptomyces sp. MBT67]MBK3552706.1 polysaccharide deacetylase family protein [Streptomyces sp. MBT61]MBK6031570.1 polysaccharide deacetylase family protein [Streptomyces sp. MBT59]
MAAESSAHRADARSSRLRPHTRRQPWILTYHSVTDPSDDPYGITVSPARLDEQLSWLRSRRLTGVGVSELLRTGASERRGLVGLTFDDGYADFVDEALPVLRKHGFRATVYVLPGRPGGVNEWDPLGPRKPLLTHEGVRRVAAAGMEVGSHGLYHRDLTGLSDEELRRETRDSRELIGDLTGSLPEGFCYPYGILDRRVTQAARSAGYGHACALTPGPLLSRFALPRTHISQADRGVRLWAKDLRHGLRQVAHPGAGARTAAPVRAGGPR